MFKIFYEKSSDNNLSLLDLAKINKIKDPCGAKIDGKIYELNYIPDKNCDIEFLNFEDVDGKKIYFHTACHIMAQAIKRIYPDAKLGFGPPTVPKVEKEIKKIISENIPVVKKTVAIDEAHEIMKKRNEVYKLELLDDLKKEKNNSVTIRTQGEFVDICKGEHLISTGMIGVIHILKITGAYWKGDSSKNMLTRIYGATFPDEKQYEKYILDLEESQKRDHNKIGRTLGYFTTVDYIGQGLPILMPKGARVVQLMQRFVEDEEEKRGYLLTKTPFLAKSDLYKISGHWYHYKENMFILGDKDDESKQFALRPMTCPFQFQVYLTKERSYRDLPMRLNETSTLFRNEQSGEMHGLIRVRQFTISEGHIACTPEQLADEFKESLDLAKFMMKTFKIDGDVYYRFSKWDPNDKKKYMGSAEEWEKAQDAMKKVLDFCGVEYVEADGEAAFYGPKLDIQFKNVYGKEDTLITIQIDFQLAQKFGMTYTDKDGEKKYAYVIHRTSLGCYERTLALLLEKYAGVMPLWLAPEQVRILPINENLIENAQNLRKKLIEAGINRVEVDKNNEKIGYKIRLAQQEKVPYMVILGQKEVANNLVSVRSNKNGDLGSMNLEDFTSKLLQEIKNKE